MDMKSFKTIVDIINSIITSGAFILGGIWAYKKLFIEAEHETSITVQLKCDLMLCNINKLRILQIRAKVNNNGKVPCQIDLPNSSIYVNVVNINEDLSSFSTHEENYSSCKSFKRTNFVNIPVGASTDVVDFSLVEHPGIYRVKVFLAQTEHDGRIFYKRLGKPFPSDWIENPSGWSDECILNTMETNN